MHHKSIDSFLYDGNFCRSWVKGDFLLIDSELTSCISLLSAAKQLSSIKSITCFSSIRTFSSGLQKNALYKVPILISLNAAWHFTENILYTILIVKLSFKAIAESWHELDWCLYPFLANVPILFPRKSPQNQRFSGVFSRYIKWEHWQEMV